MLFLISKFDIWGFQDLIPIYFLGGITLLGRLVSYFSQGSDCTQRHAAKISGWQSLPGDRCSGGRAVWHGAAAHFERPGGARLRTSPGLGGLWASKDVKGRLWSYDAWSLECFAVVWLEHVLNFDIKIGFDAVKVGSEPTNMEVYWLVIRTYLAGMPIQSLAKKGVFHRRKTDMTLTFLGDWTKFLRLELETAADIVKRISRLKVSRASSQKAHAMVKQTF